MLLLHTSTERFGLDEEKNQATTTYCKYEIPGLEDGLSVNLFDAFFGGITEDEEEYDARFYQQRDIANLHASMATFVSNNNGRLPASTQEIGTLFTVEDLYTHYFYDGELVDNTSLQDTARGGFSYEATYPGSSLSDYFLPNENQFISLSAPPVAGI